MPGIHWHELDKATMSRLSVELLREELQRRNLETTGTKDDLVQRLHNDIQTNRESTLMPDQTPSAANFSLDAATIQALAALMQQLPRPSTMKPRPNLQVDDPCVIEHNPDIYRTMTCQCKISVSFSKWTWTSRWDGMMPKRFAIVKFPLENDLVDVVPLSWLTDGRSQCFWPQSVRNQQIPLLVEAEKAPNGEGTWVKFPAEVVATSRTYSRAKEKLLHYQYQSGVESSALSAAQLKIIQLLLEIKHEQRFLRKELERRCNNLSERLEEALRGPRAPAPTPLPAVLPKLPSETVEEFDAAEATLNEESVATALRTPQQPPRKQLRQKFHQKWHLICTSRSHRKKEKKRAGLFIEELSNVQNQLNYAPKDADEHFAWMRAVKPEKKLDMQLKLLQVVKEFRDNE
ncbi:hypothetical protein HPB50_028642 [Hyalomma asiaticum]|nr:hypothetical protein HPB50_028642 [Hyalomma asiaticum]